ncbi:hypothetical protein AQJ64_44510 [Streptomyces griseoruber]|uniref:Uncharacterized protein n=1 Tax=Streptomyces griseoruber TaxID=1943 RepID=A0A117R782_9ACTN|nr:hypothetical protein AQJ64_44510 [Streptomyces griseoruber]
MFLRAGLCLEVASYCRTLVFDKARFVGQVQDGAAVLAEFPVFGRRAACLAESVALVVSGL